MKPPIPRPKSQVHSPSVFRVLDANLNRAREGVRVLEDTARFVWDRPDHFQAFKKVRHELDRLTRSAYPRLVAARDSVSDSGRREKEMEKRDHRGLVTANFRRAQEALRVLEEYGKVLAPRAASRFKALRYRLYALEKEIQLHP